MSKHFAFALLAALPLVTGFGAAARAQGAPPPVGYWTTADGLETLLVDAGGTCKFTGTNGVNSTLVLGSCSWNPSSAGGILTIINTTNYIPAPIYYNIVWVDEQTISVWGDTFYRRG